MWMLKENDLGFSSFFENVSISGTIWLYEFFFNYRFYERYVSNSFNENLVPKMRCPVSAKYKLDFEYLALK